ncbi:hypothetical protein [Streptomyces chattanoogensis]|uniref:hypothetical protein n=1 Tax=Streptomyces chattanoogensis TaxID=66876 RepID=UPI0036CA761C
MDEISGGGYFLIGAFDAEDVMCAKARFPGWSVHVEGTATMMLLVPRTAET